MFFLHTYTIFAHMNIIETNISGVFILDPNVLGDSRGYFMESFSQREFDDKVACKVLLDSHDGELSNQYLGESQIRFVQDNESRSRYGVLRGLHFQRPPFAQSKLVRVVTGNVIDVAVDIRKGSPTYGQYCAAELSEQNYRMLFLPRGMAHGFVVLSDDVLFQYKCDNFYAPQSEGAIAWNDPDLNIDWRLPVEHIMLSDKDKRHPFFKDFDSPFIY